MSKEMQARDLTLLDIESGLIELMNSRDDAETPEARAAIDTAIDAYLAQEIRKTDGIRAFLLHADFMIRAAKEEAARQKVRYTAWEARSAWLKERCMWIMQHIGKTKLEGRTGTLTVCGNGGLAPLVITNPDLIPDELCRMVGWIRADLWCGTLSAPLQYLEQYAGMLQLERVPNNEAIREALQASCPYCGGHPQIHDGCSDCHGTGKASVPGAHLAERGKNLVVK